jgi:hypothetical protein
MRFASITVLTSFAGMILCSACTSVDRSVQRPLSVSVAITPIDARSISNAQAAQVHEALRPELQRAGYTFADNSMTADLVLLVSFTPTVGGNGGRVKITGLSPTAEFRRATDNGDTPEAKEMRRRQRELEQWVERQSRNSDL